MTRPDVTESAVSPDRVSAASTGGWGLPLVVLVAGMFMSVLDTSIVSVALPAIQKQFGVAVEDSQWVVNGYTLMLGVVVPATAWLGDRFGLTRVYNLALLAFAAGSALCGLAWDLDSLVTFRILQAIPGGILPVITLSILYRIVPRDQLGAAMGLYGLGVVVAPAIGPTLGGYLVEYQTWPLIFYINVPIGLLGALAAVLVLPRFPKITGQPFDVLGFLTAGGGLFALLLATSKGPDWGWYSYRILGLLTYGVLSLALFVVIELEVADPLLDLRIFRYRAFTHSLVLISLMTLVLTPTLIYVPQLLQVYQFQKWGAFESGLTLLPMVLVMAALMPITGRLSDRFGPRWLVTIGFAIAAFSAYALRTLTIYTTREYIMWWLVGLGVGVGLAMMPNMAAGLAVVPVAQSSVGSAFNNVAQRVWGALGLAALTALFTAQSIEQMAGRAALVPANTPPINLGPTAPHGANEGYTYMITMNQASVGAMDNLFIITALLGALGALIALFLRSGPLSAAPARPAPPQQAALPPVSTDGQIAPDQIAPDHYRTPSPATTGDGIPARTTTEGLTTETETRPRER